MTDHNLNADQVLDGAWNQAEPRASIGSKRSFFGRIFGLGAQPAVAPAPVEAEENPYLDAANEPIEPIAEDGNNDDGNNAEVSKGSCNIISIVVWVLALCAAGGAIYWFIHHYASEENQGTLEDLNGNDTYLFDSNELTDAFTNNANFGDGINLKDEAGTFYNKGKQVAGNVADGFSSLVEGIQDGDKNPGELQTDAKNQTCYNMGIGAKTNLKERKWFTGFTIFIVIVCIACFIGSVSCCTGGEGNCADPGLLTTSLISMLVSLIFVFSVGANKFGHDSAAKVGTCCKSGADKMAADNVQAHNALKQAEKNGTRRRLVDDLDAWVTPTVIASCSLLAVIAVAGYILYQRKKRAEKEHLENEFVVV